VTVRVVIVDDEDLARRGIRSRLRRFEDAEVIAECRNGADAIETIRRISPDLVFLDVQMPGQSGFDVIEAVGHTKFPHVIFVTAHDHYAICAFEVNALDYLLKPIDDERFDIAFSRARESISRDRDGTLARRLASALNDIAPATSARHTPDRIVVRSAGRVCFVKTSDVDWIQASGDYVTLHTGKKEWLLRETLTELERQLSGKGFIRIHRSTIVNLDRVTELRPADNGEYQVILNNGAELKLTRNYRDALDRFLK